MGAKRGLEVNTRIHKSKSNLENLNLIFQKCFGAAVDEVVCALPVLGKETEFSLGSCRQFSFEKWRHDVEDQLVGRPVDKGDGQFLQHHG